MAQEDSLRRLREYPAYGRAIAQQIAQGHKPICVGVMLSSRWGYFNHAPKVCIKPDEWASGKFEFGFLRGRHLVALWGDDCSERQFGELLLELMLAGPAMLWAYACDGTKLLDEDADSSQTVAFWVWQLFGRDRGVRDPSIHYARMHFSDSARAAARAELRELEAVQARKEGEDLIRWYIEQFKRPDRVRELFSQPFLQANEPAAA